MNCVQLVQQLGLDCIPSGDNIFGFEVMHLCLQLVLLLLGHLGVHPVFLFWGRDSSWSCGFMEFGFDFKNCVIKIMSYV